MRLFILGAGSSIGTFGLPGVQGFGSHLAANVSNWPAKFGGLAGIVQALEPKNRRSMDDWDLDAAWTHVDYLAKMHHALDAGPNSNSAAHGLKAAVAAVYGDIDAHLTRAKAAHDAGKPFTLSDELDRVVDGDVVASFNWDVAAETLLLHKLKGKSLAVVQAPHARLKDAVVFTKPHGSLAWSLYEIVLQGTVAIADNTQPKLAPIPTPSEILWDEFETDLSRKRTPFMLGAVPIKSELIAQIGSNEYRVVMAQWAAFLRAISEADEICVMGYSFPKEDSYARFLIREAVRRRVRPIVKVDLYEVPAKEREVCKAIREVFGRLPNGLSPKNIDPKGPVGRCP